ncbi:MAG: NAD(P)/FAD-dependent oxidoreductase [Solirubrobacteraceae bacterium]
MASRAGPDTNSEPRHRVVIVGGGFGGLQAARRLGREPVEVTLIDRRNFHLFQPLLYQAATGALAPEEIAAPLRAILERDEYVRVMMGEVRGFDLGRRTVVVDELASGERGREIEYDTLIVSGGFRYSYFGHEEWQRHALEVQSLESAIAVRSRIFTAFEAAEVEPDRARRDAWLTFVVVGGGPTGVEMAGQIAELARDTLARDFRAIDSRQARILLVEASERMLPAFAPRLSRKASKALQHLGVTARTDHRLGGRSGRLRARRRARGRQRHRARPGRAGGGAGRPDDPRTSRGDGARGHGQRAGRRRARGPVARPDVGGDAAGSLRGGVGGGAAARRDCQAVSLRGQGQPGHDRTGECGG